MQYVQRTKTPILLVENQVKWAAPWLAYNSAKKAAQQPQMQLQWVQKPSSAHWLKKAIRQPLINNFNNNCGYCGEILPTPSKPLSEKEKRLSSDQANWLSIGDVDHFWPKSTFPEKVYHWNNYIWCCKNCNSHKRDFYSLTHPLLDPCSKDDCQALIFDQSTGRYRLVTNLANKHYWQKRFEHSELHTLFNSEQICDKRHSEIGHMQGYFESLQNAITRLKAVRQLAINALITDAKLDITKNIQLIQKSLTYPSYRLLIAAQYQQLLQQYPQIKAQFEQQVNHH
ncbi:MAG: hypothetical protein ACI9FJ_000035 [Alteromonadaceae bacterium]|jgi:hypothetical protein